MHQHSLILGLCIPKTHCGLTVSTCFCRCAHQGSSRVIESIFVVQAFEAFTVQYIALEKYENFANLYIYIYTRSLGPLRGPTSSWRTDFLWRTDGRIGYSSKWIYDSIFLWSKRQLDSWKGHSCCWQPFAVLKSFWFLIQPFIRQEFYFPLLEKIIIPNPPSLSKDKNYILLCHYTKKRNWVKKT